jgi:hypothetical protein
VRRASEAVGDTLHASAVNGEDRPIENRPDAGVAIEYFLE